MEDQPFNVDDKLMLMIFEGTDLDNGCWSVIKQGTEVNIQSLCEVC